MVDATSLRDQALGEHAAQTAPAPAIALGLVPQPRALAQRVAGRPNSVGGDHSAPLPNASSSDLSLPRDLRTRPPSLLKALALLP
jgi:hypothetical protein